MSNNSKILSDDYIRENAVIINWSELIKSQTLSEDIVKTHFKYIDEHLLIQTQQMSMRFLRAYRGHLNYMDVCKYQVLTEEFIEENYRWISWCVVSEYQNLSVAFMDKYAHRICWNCFEKASKHITPEKIKRLKDRINVRQLSANPFLSERILRQYSKELDWDVIARNGNFTFRFAWLMRDRINISQLNKNRNLSIYFKKRFINMFMEEKERQSQWKENLHPSKR